MSVISDWLESWLPAGTSGWSKPFDVSDPSGDAGRRPVKPQVRVGPNGEIVFVWQQPVVYPLPVGSIYQIQTLWRSPSGVPGQIETLSPLEKNASDPHVALSANGAAFYAWVDDSVSRVYGVARSPAGILSEVLPLSDDGQAAYEPQVAVDANGKAVFVWTRNRTEGPFSRVQMCTWAFDGVPNQPTTLSDEGQNADQPQVVLDQGGKGYVTWRRKSDRGFEQQVQAKTLPAMSKVTLSVVEQETLSPRVAMRDTYPSFGMGVFAWLREGGQPPYEVQTRSWSGTNSPTNVQTLFSSQGELLHVQDPGLAVDALGTTVFVWQRYDSVSATTIVEARARSAVGELSPTQTLSVPGQNPLQTADDPQVAVNASGDAIFTWRRRDGTHYRIQTRARSAAGKLGKLRTLTAAGQDAVEPQIAVGVNGRAAVVWSLSDGTNSRIQAAWRRHIWGTGDVLAPQ